MPIGPKGEKRPAVDIDHSSLVFLMSEFFGLTKRSSSEPSGEVSGVGKGTTVPLPEPGSLGLIS